MITAKLISELVKPRQCNPDGDIFGNRFYDFNVPRCIGKTTAIREFAKGKSALKLRGIMSYEDNDWYSLQRPDPIVNMTRGFRSLGLKYNYILIDEYQPKLVSNLVLLISHLKVCGLLTDDYVIISVRTG